MKTTRILPAAVAAAALFSAAAQDWPQWGGRPERNMVSTARGLPARFDPGRFRSDTDGSEPGTATNLLWTVKLGGQSYGNVTVSGGRVYVGTNNDHPRDPRHQGDRSVLMCFNEGDGKFLWQLVIPKLPAGSANDWESTGLLASPTVEGRRIYLVTTRGEVMCLDAAGQSDGNDGPFQDEARYSAEPGSPPAETGPGDADILWIYNMREESGVFPHNASNGSVVVLDDLVYAPTSNGRDWTQTHVPFPFAPSLIAVNRTNGAFVVADDAGIGPRIWHGQWSSPCAGKAGGRRLIVHGGGDGWCYAFDAVPAHDGTNAVLKTVWKCNVNPPEYAAKPYGDPDGPSEIIATPAFTEGRVYAVTGQDPEQGDGAGRLVCIDASKTGDISQSGVIWDFKGIRRSMSTASVDTKAGLLFIADFSGYVHCLDAATGRPHWTFDMKAHVWGSTLLADGRVYVADEDGDLSVLPATKNFDPKKEKPLWETSLGAPVCGTPVAANGTLFVQTATHLFAFKTDAGGPDASPPGEK